MKPKYKTLPDYNDPDDLGTLICKKYRYFDASEVEKEEEYLTQMHREGWKLTKVGEFGIYHFESCEPEDVVYRIDFNPSAADDRENYLQMYADYGWECAAALDDYRYFRKSAEKSSPADNEIFSDDSSRLAMMHTIIRKQLLFSVYATVSSTLVFVLMYSQLPLDRTFNLLGISACGVLLLIFYACLLRRIIGFCRFHKKYSKKKVG